MNFLAYFLHNFLNSAPLISKFLNWSKDAAAGLNKIKHFFFLCQWPLIWFDRELKSVFNFDVYSSSFDKKLGFGYYKSDDSNKLVIKFERFII